MQRSNSSMSITFRARHNQQVPCHSRLSVPGMGAKRTRRLNDGMRVSPCHSSLLQQNRNYRVQASSPPQKACPRNSLGPLTKRTRDSQSTSVRHAPARKGGMFQSITEPIATEAERLVQRSPDQNPTRQKRRAIHQRRPEVELQLLAAMLTAVHDTHSRIEKKSWDLCETGIRRHRKNVAHQHNRTTPSLEKSS